jgi:hypothetical protein
MKSSDSPFDFAPFLYITYFRTCVHILSVDHCIFDPSSANQQETQTPHISINTSNIIATINFQVPAQPNNNTPTTHITMSITITMGIHKKRKKKKKKKRRKEKNKKERKERKRGKKKGESSINLKTSAHPASHTAHQQTPHYPLPLYYPPDYPPDYPPAHQDPQTYADPSPLSDLSAG